MRQELYHLVLPALSGSYPRLQGRLAIHYSPVRHWCIATPVRLACLSHAASVQAEPGSNSSIEFLGPSHSSCTASSCDLAATDSFMGRFILETSLSYTRSTKTIDQADYCPGMTIPEVSQQTTCVACWSKASAFWQNFQSEDSLLGVTRMLKIWCGSDLRHRRLRSSPALLLDTGLRLTLSRHSDYSLVKEHSIYFRSSIYRHLRLASFPSIGSHIVSQPASLSTARYEIFYFSFGSFEGCLRLPVSHCQPER
jgi:hypothetical protein